jgi:hypothetical protein
MPTLRQSIYQAILADLDAALSEPVFLNDAGDRDMEELGSHAVLYTPEAPDIESETIGVPHYEFREDLELEFYVQDADALDRVTLIDEAAQKTVDAVHRSNLGGLATIVLVGPYSIDQERLEGAIPAGFGRIPITVYYESSSPVS